MASYDISSSSSIDKMEESTSSTAAVIPVNENRPMKSSDSDTISDPSKTTTTTSNTLKTQLSLDDLTPGLASLQDLATRGSWRSIIDKTRNPSSTFPHHNLTYTCFYLLALTKLRRYDDLSLHLSSLDDLDSPQHRYESYPDLYPHRSGSMVPFSLRWIHAQLPLRLGQPRDTLDRFYILLDFVRSKILDKASTLHSLHLWKKRECFVINSIIGLHLSNKEFHVCLDLIQQSVRGDSFNPTLLSKLGYIQMQLGHLEAAKAAFDQVEGLTNGYGMKLDGLFFSEIEFKNLVNRNKALMYIVAKDYASAVREYDQCIERDGSDVVAINNKGICLMYLRDLLDSIKVLETALECVPTVALNETLVVNLCSMYELAYVNHSDIKRTLNTWIAKIAPDDFDSSGTRT